METPVELIGDVESSTTALTHGSLFAGIGGLCSSFNEAGFESKFVNELDERVMSVYRANFPRANLICKSIKDLVVQDVPQVDVLHGGFPCQSFSVAGLRSGFEDPRGQLFFEITRIIREYQNVKPKAIVLENSPNLLIGDSGNWFRRVSMELSKAGYWFDRSNAILLNTSLHSGIPQNRERLFMIALNADWFDWNPIRQSDFYAVPLRPISTFVGFDEDVDDRYYLDQSNKYSRLIIDARVPNPEQIYQLRKHFVRIAPTGLCPTLTANMGHGGHNVPFVITKKNRVRKLTEIECLRLQGFDERFLFPNEVNNSARYAMIGNAVSPQISALIAKRLLTVL